MQAHLHTPLTTKTTYTKALEMGRRDYAPHWAEAPCAGAQCPAKLAHVPGSQAHTCVLYTRAAYRRRQPCLLKQTRGQQARLAPTLQEPQRRSASARSATRARSAAARGSRAPGRGPHPTRAAAQARTRPPASLRHARDRVRTSVTAAVALRPWPASGGGRVLRAPAHAALLSCNAPHAPGHPGMTDSRSRSMSRRRAVSARATSAGMRLLGSDIRGARLMARISGSQRRKR